MTSTIKLLSFYDLESPWPVLPLDFGPLARVILKSKDNFIRGIHSQMTSTIGLIFSLVVQSVSRQPSLHTFGLRPGGCLILMSKDYSLRLHP